MQKDTQLAVWVCWSGVFSPVHVEVMKILQVVRPCPRRASMVMKYLTSRPFGVLSALEVHVVSVEQCLAHAKMLQSTKSAPKRYKPL